MNKILIGTAAAIAVLTTAVYAQGYSFTRNLSVGSKGDDVSALQTLLISAGFHIPAIENGTANKGTFGSLTKAAVQKYQAAHGISTTGTVGPITRASLSGTAPMSALPPQSPSVPPPVSSAPPLTTGISTPGVAGTIVLALQSTPANGTSVDKGQTVNIARYKLQAGASDMQLTSFALDWNARLWLYAAGITITDDSGAVVASKSGITQNDFTEVTVGSDYRITIPLSNVLPKAATKYLKVNVVMLPVTDRSSGSIGITRAQLRATDGTGVTDTETDSNTRTFSFTGSTNGLVVITADQNNPPNMLVQVSTSGTTDDVVMGIADVKSQGIDSVLRSINLILLTSSTTNPTTVFRDVKVKAGNLVYSTNSVGTSLAFTNMSIPLPKDTVVPLYILVSLNKDTNNLYDGIAASTTLIASGTAGGTTNNPVVEDSSFNTVDINDAPLATSDLTFSASNAEIDYLSTVAKLGPPVISNNSVSTYPVTMTFKVTAGNNTLYIAANPSVALATSSSGLVSNASASLSEVTVIPGNIAGDQATTTSNTTAYYVIPAGSSRKFIYSGSVNNTGGTNGLKIFQITGVKYGLTTSTLTANTIVFFNYAKLKVTPTF